MGWMGFCPFFPVEWIRCCCWFIGWAVISVGTSDACQCVLQPCLDLGVLIRVATALYCRQYSCTWVLWWWGGAVPVVYAWQFMVMLHYWGQSWSMAKQPTTHCSAYTEPLLCAPRHPTLFHCCLSARPCRQCLPWAHGYGCHPITNHSLWGHSVTVPINRFDSDGAHPSPLSLLSVFYVHVEPQQSDNHINAILP